MRCVTVIEVLSANTFSRDCSIATSVFKSTEDVTSSKMSIGGSVNNVLAIAILCLCPPDKLTPFSPTQVLYLSGSEFINSLICAKLAASSICFKVAFGMP